MKKTKVIFQKQSGSLVEQHADVYYEMLSSIKDGQFVEGEFSEVKKNKSNEQLGYLYSGVYPFAVYWFKETRGPVLYEITLMGYSAPVEVNVESVDLFFKVLFAQYKGREYKKRKMKVDEMAEFIDFIDKFCIEKFGETIPPPKKKELV